MPPLDRPTSTPESIEFDQLLLEISSKRRTVLNTIFQKLDQTQQQAVLKAYRFFKIRNLTLEIPIDDDLKIYINEFLLPWGLNEWTMSYLQSFSEDDIRVIFEQGVPVNAESLDQLIQRQSIYQEILSKINYITPLDHPKHFADQAEILAAKAKGQLKGVIMKNVDGLVNNEGNPVFFARAELVNAMQELDRKLAEKNLNGHLCISSDVRDLKMQELFYKLGFPAIRGKSFHTQGLALDFPLSRTGNELTEAYKDIFANEIDEEKLKVVNSKLEKGETLTVEKLAEWGIIRENHPLMQIIKILKEMEPLGIQFLDETYFNSVESNPVEVKDEDDNIIRVVYLCKSVKPDFHVQYNVSIIKNES